MLMTYRIELTLVKKKESPCNLLPFKMLGTVESKLLYTQIRVHLPLWLYDTRDKTSTQFPDPNPYWKFKTESVYKRRGLDRKHHQKNLQESRPFPVVPNHFSCTRNRSVSWLKYRSETVVALGFVQRTGEVQSQSGKQFYITVMSKVFQYHS